jgi:hypothetical protein
MIFKRGRYYYVKFKFQGRLIRRSTKAMLPEDARTIEAKIRSELALGHWGILEPKAPALRELMSKPKPRPGERIEEILLTPEVIEQYLAECPQPWKDVATIILNTALAIFDKLPFGAVSEPDSGGLTNDL